MSKNDIFLQLPSCMYAYSFAAVTGRSAGSACSAVTRLQWPGKRVAIRLTLARSSLWYY